MSNALTLFPYDAMWRETGCAYRAMEDVRADLKASVVGLTQEEIERDPGSGAQSIAMLLCHAGGAEAWWMRRIWRKEEIPEAWKKVVLAGDPRKTPADARGLSIETIFATLDAVREDTRLFLMKLTDTDLDRQTVQTKAGKATPRYVLHHLVEHEAHHRGQITLLRRLFGKPLPAAT